MNRKKKKKGKRKRKKRRRRRRRSQMVSRDDPREDTETATLMPRSFDCHLISFFSGDHQRRLLLACHFFHFLGDNGVELTAVGGWVAPSARNRVTGCTWRWPSKEVTWPGRVAHCHNATRWKGKGYRELCCFFVVLVERRWRVVIDGYNRFQPVYGWLPSSSKHRSAQGSRWSDSQWHDDQRNWKLEMKLKEKKVN